MKMDTAKEMKFIKNQLLLYIYAIIAHIPKVYYIKIKKMSAVLAIFSIRL